MIKSASAALVVLSLVLSIAIGWAISRRHETTGVAAAREGSGPVIGLSMDTLKEARWQKDRDIFTKRATELGAAVLVQSANSDDTRQIQDVKSLIANHVDGKGIGVRATHNIYPLLSGRDAVR